MADVPSVKEGSMRLKLALEGKTAEEIAKELDCPVGMGEAAIAAIRKRELPELSVPEISILKDINYWDSKHRDIVKLHFEGKKQKEIAKELECSQSTVSYVLAKLKLKQSEMRYMLQEGRTPHYISRLHIYLHCMDDIEALRTIDFGPSIDIEKEADEMLRYESPELILMNSGYCEYQLDKLVMDIVLATKGQCAVIADTYDAAIIGPTHIVYYLRDCIQTRNLDGSKDECGWDVPMKAPIQYMEDWFKHLNLYLSPNDQEKLKKAASWRF